MIAPSAPGVTGLETGPATQSERLSRMPGWLVVAIPVLAELIVGGYRIAGPSLWRDEAATIVAAQRPFGAILALVGNDDAVHAPYYLLMHLVIGIGGTSETALRLPSLIAMSIAAGLTAALGRRLARTSALPAPAATGLLAGLALAAAPLSTRYAQEARPYALTTLFAVLASYLLVRAAAGSRRGWWAAYAGALALTGLFNLFALPLLALAHGATLELARPAAGEAGAVDAVGEAGAAGGIAAGGAAGGIAAGGSPAGRSPWLPWLVSCLVAAVVVAPIGPLSAAQSTQISWVTRPGLSALASLIRDFAGGMTLIIVVAFLGALGVVGGTGIRRGAGFSLAAVALPWLVVPPLMLLAVSLADPVYVERYVVFCLPALSLLIGAGLTWLVQLVRISGRWRSFAPAPSVLLGVIMVLALAGPQVASRQATARVDNLRAVAAALAGHERPGDAIMYLPWGTRLVGLAYPAPFQRLDDVELGLSPVASATLRGIQAAPEVVAARLAGRSRVGAARVWTVRWAVSPVGVALTPTDQLAASWTAGLRLVQSWRIGSVVLSLYSAR